MLRYHALMTSPTDIPFKLIFKVAAGIALVAALWFLVVAPRLELADEKVDRAETNQTRAEKVTEALEVLADAQADVDQEAADAKDAVAAEEIRYIERDRVIRERIVEQAVQDGDPFVSDGMDAFLKDFAQ